MPNNDTSVYRTNRKIFRYFIVIFICFGAILATGIGFLHHLESRDYLGRLELEERVNVNLQMGMISTKLESIVSDLSFLSRQNELLYLINDNGDDDIVKALIADEYLEFCRKKRIYDQIRYIDAAGMEVVRVNFNDGRPAAAAPEDLRSKADRHFFRETITLGPDEVFVSSFDLRVENGEIERPLRPIIRFAMSVFDRSQQRRGIVVLNYLGGELIGLTRASDNLSSGRIMLINGDGYWLSGPDPDDEWGFLIPGRSGRKFSTRFPRAWQRIAAADRCQIYTPEGLFTAATLYPLKEGVAAGLGSTRAYGDNILSVRDDEYYWKIVSHVPSADLDAGPRGLWTKLAMLSLYLSLLAAVPSWLLAQAFVRRKLDQIELHRSAHYDRLTGLPNRALFMDRLNQAIKDARRYERWFALMFIDLDGFKAVNDTLGHAAGDRVLAQVAARLVDCLRDSDTVARMGGDEFTVILPNVDSPISAHRVAKKIIEALNAPFSIPGHAPHVGACIGISLFPEDGTDVDTLLKKADDAMYQAKKNGKNDYRFYTATF